MTPLLLLTPRDIISNIMVKAAKTAIYPLQVLVNYWEMKPARMGVKLNHLLRQGITHVATFVPWQAAEADISHSLVRFLQAISDRKMTVSLILSPEVGVYYANSGLPKDLLGKKDIQAITRDEKPATVTLPPNFFALPSLSSPEFLKRYHQFLTRMDGVIAELSRTQPEVLSAIQVVLTGSFWKYYRSAQASSGAPFKGVSGDYSNHSELAFRQYTEALFSHREFQASGSQSSSRWRKREMEGVNRQSFFQNCEDVFRIRSTQFIRKKALGLDVVQAEMSTPEADPAYQYSQVMNLVTGGIPDFPTLDRLVGEAASRQSVVGNSRTRPMIHWTGFGAFSRLSDSEKQYLVLKSLLLMGGNRGSVLIDEAEWFALSSNFRARSEMLSKVVFDQDLELETRAVCWTAHLWSEGRGENSQSPLFWPELRLSLDHQARLVASSDALDWEKNAKLLCIEPSVVLTRDKLQRAMKWAEGGRVVCVSRQALLTDDSRIELDMISKNAPFIEMNLGARYRVHTHGQGKIVIYENASVIGDWRKFIHSMISLAGINRDATVKDPRIDLVQLARGTGKAGLFIFNGTRTALSSEVSFEYEVTISDLATLLSQKADAPTPAGLDDGAHSNHFELEVPPCGVLPVAVSGIGEEGREKREARLSAGLTAKLVSDAAKQELTGLNDSDDMGELLQ